MNSDFSQVDRLKCAFNPRGAIPANSIAAVTMALMLGLAGSGCSKWSDPAANQTKPAETARRDALREMQQSAIESNQASWGRWGVVAEKFSSWDSHSNRLVPVYTHGLTLDEVDDEKSCYRDENRLREIYGYLPENTLNPQATYFDQTDIYRLQQQALAAGKIYIILIIFDGLDWDTTRAAALYRAGKVTYSEGRGTGLAFQDYRGPVTDFGFMVTSPRTDVAIFDVNAQLVTASNSDAGGYNAPLGGDFPWSRPQSPAYLIAQDPAIRHVYTDSASSASSMTSRIKTYNSAINCDVTGKMVVPIARELQDKGFSIGVVTSVPISHATPAAAYANNVSRDDYQDLTRDLLGLPSVANRAGLSGVDVLIGGGWGADQSTPAEVESGRTEQGLNFQPGNRYLTQQDLASIDVRNGGKYVVATRTSGQPGNELLLEAMRTANRSGKRLFGFFGTRYGHLPYATANGDYQPTRGDEEVESYDRADILENPTLAEMTRAALLVLETHASAAHSGIWLMIEAGDVDWASHNQNLDDAIGAVYSGDAAFQEVCRWAESRGCWADTAIIVTADHGHLFFLEDPAAIAEAGKASR